MVFLALVVPARALAAQTEREAPWQQPAPWRLGIVANAGLYSGIAAGVELDLRWIGARVSGGYLPLLVVTEQQGSGDIDLEFFNTGQLNVDLFSLFFRPIPRSRVGLSAAYKYNSLLGHAGGLAFEAQIALGRVVALHLILGLAVYPEGEDRVEEELGRALDYGFPGAILQGIANIGVVFYPGGAASSSTAKR
jgi:hypothetical protein